MTNQVFVAGHNGMVGSALCRELGKQDIDLITASRSQLDLTNQSQVKAFFMSHQFDEVYLAAAKVGGIKANNSFPAEYIYENLMIQSNVIHQSFQSSVKKLLLLGSSCIYPKLAKQPISESELMTGPLEATNEPYAVAKIAGIKLCESYNRQYGCDYRSVMPANLYGQNDNFHPENSHVLPALIRRFHEAKMVGAESVNAWGTGTPMREFLHVDDMAAASLFVMRLDKNIYNSSTEPMLSHINVGSGQDCSIRQLTELVAKVVGYRGQIEWDLSKPDGAPRKLMDNSKLRQLGWAPNVNLEEGIQSTYDWFVDNLATVRL